jgi:hypothetical protein
LHKEDEGPTFKTTSRLLVTVIMGKKSPDFKNHKGL